MDDVKTKVESLEFIVPVQYCTVLYPVDYCSLV